MKQQQKLRPAKNTKEELISRHLDELDRALPGHNLVMLIAPEDDPQAQLAGNIYCPRKMLMQLKNAVQQLELKFPEECPCETRMKSQIN